MFELLRSMLKEEWRIHATMFGGLLFLLFPVLVAGFSFFCVLLLAVMPEVLPAGRTAVLGHYAFAFFGLSVGAFGLFGREALNRRFGQASLVAYSSRTLPISDRWIFLNFLVKDVVYYLFLWILPFIFGFYLASPLLGVGRGLAGLLILTLSLSFLTGLSVAFFLSTLYAHSGSFFRVALALLVFFGIVASDAFGLGLAELLPPLSVYYGRAGVGSSILPVLALCAVSLAFLKVDYPKRRVVFRDSLGRLSGLLDFGGFGPFLTKDFLDLHRSEGGLGKLVFSFLFPLAFVWLLLSVLAKFMPSANFLLLFSVLLGVLASAIYSWLTEYDLFSSYAFLPVRVSGLMKSKVAGYALLNLVPVAALAAVALRSGLLAYFPVALVLFAAVSAYSLSVTAYLGGLSPNVVLYNAKVFLEYVVFMIPALVAVIFLSAAGAGYALLGSLLFFPAAFLLKKSYSRWERAEQPGF